MTLSWADKKILSQTRMVKAREFLEDAKENFREGRVKTSIYGDFDSADAADAEEAIRLASEAVEEIEQLRTALLQRDEPYKNATEDEI